MIGPEFFWFVMGGGLIAYGLTGGADFGGGLWDLVARGARKDAQRAVIERAIAPIWEANHVWLIFVIVLMFTVFPYAFAAIGVALHIPIVLALVGIVLRGASFTFRAYGLETDAVRARWGRVFAWSSVVTPILLGVTLGALSTGDIRVDDGHVVSGYLAGWLAPFSWLTGFLALALFSLLAAVYLTAEAEGEVQADFRLRALLAEIVAGVFAALAFWRASVDAPAFFDRLARSSWTVAVQAITMAAALSTMALLWKQRFAIARFTAALQVSSVLIGWGLAMDGYIIRPDIHILSAGARAEVMGPLAPTLAIGAILLLPSLYALFRVFKVRAKST